MEFHFTGYLSGDHECFCFSVPLEDFIKLAKRKPESFDKCWFVDGHYRIYPNDLLGYGDDKKYSFHIKIEMTEKQK